MKYLKMAFVAMCAVASTSASAGMIQTPASAGLSAKVSTCYYEYTIITADAVYDVYTCYDNGNGTA